MDEIMMFAAMPFDMHLISSFLLRCVFIQSGVEYDRYYYPRYTHVEYEIMNDAAKFVLNGKSPYASLRFKHSPIVAWLGILNVMIDERIGKVIFTLFDLMIGDIIRCITHAQFDRRKDKVHFEEYGSLLWLYNYFSVITSSSGNPLSMSSFFILISMFFMHCYKVTSTKNYVLSGMCMGLAIHMRIYALGFGVALYMSMNDKYCDKLPVNSSFLPNKRQMIFAAACTTTLFLLTAGMYQLYGYDFFIRTFICDIFGSNLNYYKGATHDLLDETMYLHLLKVFVLLLISSVFSCKLLNLPSPLFYQATVMYVFSRNCDSQYLIYIFIFLPLVIQSHKKSISMFTFFIYMTLSFITWNLTSSYVELVFLESQFMLLLMRRVFYFIPIIIFMCNLEAYAERIDINFFPFLVRMIG